MARPAYKSQPAPARVARGTVSRPTPLPKWRPKPQPAPTKVTSPRTIA